MKIIFAGTPEISLETLRTLCNSHNHEVKAVICGPDHIIKKEKKAPPVKEYIKTQNNITIIQPETFDEKISKQIFDLKPDILVCFAYGKIFPQEILDLFPLGGINFHPSALPLLRGPSPIQFSIMLKMKSLGLTVQKMSKKMDAGHIIIQKNIKIDDKETTLSLSRRVSLLAGSLIIESLDILKNNPQVGIPQNESMVTFSSFITKEIAYLDYQKSAEELEYLVRAMYDDPIARTNWNSKLLLIFRTSIATTTSKHKCEPNGKVVDYDPTIGILVKTANGLLVLEEIQIAGKKRLFHKDFMNGNQPILGAILC